MNCFLITHRYLSRSILVILLSLSIAIGCSAFADDIPIGVTYVCNGEHIFVENCNMRDTSDTSTCMVGHPDHIKPVTGVMTYTYETRASLRKFLPTCQQPSAQALAAAKARQQKIQETVDAQQKKAEDSVAAPPTAAQIQSAMQQAMIPKDPAERQMNRCISAGRLPASCTGNALLGGFTNMISSTVSSITGTKPADDSNPQAGMTMAGVYVGTGNWRVDFVTGGVLVNCSFLSPSEETYSVKFEGGQTGVVINTKPKPLVLTLRPDGTMTAPGPVTINGVVASGYHEGNVVGTAAYRDPAGNYYDSMGNKLQQTAGYSTFSPKTATCPALNLTSKGAGVGIETMQTDLLKTAFGGDKGPPTPSGIRMTGIYAASTGFSAQFFPESVILGCGPDAARAYPYEVAAGPSGGVVKINAPDRPLTLAIRSDNTLDPGTSQPYQVHGRIVMGRDNNDNPTFAPYEQTCGLALLTPSKSIPTNGGGSMATMMASTKPANSSAAISSAAAPLGNAVLSIISGLTAPAGQVNPLAGRPLVLLRQSYGDVLAHAGVMVPAGISPYQYAGTACGTGSPDCQKISQAIQANAVSAIRADAAGKGTLPGVPPGTYFLMVSAIYNKQPLVWGQPVQIRAGENSITLDEHNATPLR